METRFRTPLLDLFRRGEVSRDIKLLAARGVVAPRAHEQLLILAALTDDGEVDVREDAEQTLGLIPRAAVAAFLARSDAPSELREFFAARGIQPAGAPMEQVDEPLIERETDMPGGRSGAERGAAYRLSMMSVSERIKVAMRGTREERSILIRDANKLVAVAVLSSPKLTDSEVESIARMASVSDEVLRIIGSTRAWVKHYGVAVALARNPKTPLTIALRMVQRLTDRDLKILSIDRNAQEPLRLAARKLVTAAAKTPGG